MYIIIIIIIIIIHVLVSSAGAEEVMTIKTDIYIYLDRFLQLKTPVLKKIS